MENQPKKQEKVFSFYPDKLGHNPDGSVYTMETNPYKILDALGTGTIYFTVKDAKFWIGEGKECPEEMFTKQFLPKIRWEFDQFVQQEKYTEVEVEVEDAKGNKKVEKQRRLVGTETINKFPCTTKNILKKRAELIAAAASSGSEFNVAQIQKQTSPQQLLPSDDVLEATKPQGFRTSTYSTIKNLLRS